MIVSKVISIGKLKYLTFFFDEEDEHDCHGQLVCEVL